MTKKTIGVLCSGGDAPGMNAALRAIVRTSIYHGHRIYAIKRGYQGMIENDIEELQLSTVSNIIKAGGTIILTARSEDFFTKNGREKAYANLKEHGIDSLIVIGGDGSFHGLHEFLNEHPIQGIGVPGTIDNDLFGTDFTIGFDTAVNTALDAIDRIRDTATSHQRVFIVEVMGRSSGYIALYTGIGGGAEQIFIPETPVNVEELCLVLCEGEKRGKKSSIIVVAEGEKQGQAFQIKKQMEEFLTWDVRLSILGHQQRGGSPTASDRVLASRLGYESVLALMNNENDKMVGIVNNSVVVTSLQDTWMKKKAIDFGYLEMNKILAT